MKAVYCTACGDIRGLGPAHTPVSCRCGRSHGRWVDPQRGIAIFCETTPEGEYSTAGHCRLLGIHNDALAAHPRYHSWQIADGYLFQKYETMILNIPPGGSSDTRLTGVEEVFGDNQFVPVGER